MQSGGEVEGPGGKQCVVFPETVACDEIGFAPQFLTYPQIRQRIDDIHRRLRVPRQTELVLRIVQAERLAEPEYLVRRLRDLRETLE